MRKIRVAAIALATRDGCPEANINHALEMCRTAGKQAHPQVILLPEAFTAGYCAPDLSRYAENIPGPSVAAFLAVARELDAIICFGMLEKAPGGIYNSAVLVDGKGVIGIHRKAHLYLDPTRPYRNEHALLLPGGTLEPVATPLAKIGILICYETTFPEAWRTLALKGAEFLLLPYNCERDHFERVRQLPLLNVIPVVAADRTGTVFQGDRWEPNLGTAFAIDEAGKVLGHTAPGVEAILAVEIDLEKAGAARRESFTSGYYHCRRPDLYSLTAASSRPAKSALL